MLQVVYWVGKILLNTMGISLSVVDIKLVKWEFIGSYKNKISDPVSYMFQLKQQLAIFVLFI